MSVKWISSRDNPDLRHLRALASDGRARREAGETLLDGAHLIEEALAAGLPLLTVALTEANLSVWSTRVTATTRLLVLPEALLASLSPVATPSGVVASMRVPVATDMATTTDAILLEAIQDPGNLGALLRTAAAAGVQRIYLSPGCAEAWSPKALRGGQGAQFRLQIHEGCDLLATAANLAMPVYAAALGAGRSLYALNLTGPVAFALGNEGAGLSAGLQAVTTGFEIPMPGGTESLNVAAACAVALFEQVRQRLP